MKSVVTSHGSAIAQPATCERANQRRDLDVPSISTHREIEDLP